MTTKISKSFVQSTIEYFWDVNDLEKRIHQIRKKINNIFEHENLNYESLRDLVVLMIFYGTPLDISEIVGIKVENLERVEMGRFKLNLKSNDGRKERSFVLPTEVSTAIENMIRVGEIPEYAHLFVNQNQNPLSHPELFRVVQNYSNEKLLRQVGADSRLTVRDQYMVLPTPARLQANPNFTGKDVTIAFLDSGFYPHPDLVQPTNRILKYVDLTGRNVPLEEPNLDAWHGTMTTVCCAGNGYSSNGLYSGIAKNANLVLLAVGEDGGIDRDNILKGIRWVIENREKYNIKILNISLGSGLEISFRSSPIDEAAELAIQAGITVVAAAGNDPFRPSVPPANSPNVITVGGFNDKNVPFETNYSAYHSQFGKTIDGLTKPEITAPGTLIAAPILPKTPLFDKARVLFYLKSIPDEDLKREIKKLTKVLELEKEDIPQEPQELRKLIDSLIQGNKLISPTFQHVDGTSFGAPVVCSVVAQMVEANPNLPTHLIREILINTAVSIPHIPRERQGYGTINAMEAVESVERDEFLYYVNQKDFPKVEGNQVTFRFESDDEWESVSVAGDFNKWDFVANPLEKVNGNWEAKVEVQFPGQYRYKFVLNKSFWIEDPKNNDAEPDSFGGMNSIFEVNEYSYSEESFNDIFKILHIEKNEDLRENALSALDFNFRWQSSARSEKVFNYFEKCMENALQKLSSAPPKKGLEIIQLYNCGTILRTKDFCIGIDIVTTRHVWGVNWKISEKIASKLTDKLDLLLVTQRLPDHLDIDIVHQMLRRDKNVVVPQEDKDLISSECQGILPSGNLEFKFGRTKFKISASRALHSFDGGRKISQRNYELKIGRKKILFLADHDYTEFLDYSGKIDILFAKIGELNLDYTPIEARKVLLKKVQPELLIPTHIAELGHPVEAGQGSYDKVADSLRGCEVNTKMLSWSESLFI